MGMADYVEGFLAAKPPDQRTNAIRWLQNKVIAMARELPLEFSTRKDWEAFRRRMAVVALDATARSPLMSVEAVCGNPNRPKDGANERE